MKIKEVSEKTGLTKKTIRFYESEGLVAPEKVWKNGREYRDYSEADIQQLERIAALRRARFSVEEIRHIQSVPGDIPEVFDTYRRRLQQDQQDLTAILAIVNNISSNALTDEDTLIEKMSPATNGLPLPAVDLDPHFRYLDELEELSMLTANRFTPLEERQKNMAARNAAIYSTFTPQNSVGNEVAARTNGGFDISTSQKIAAYNLLQNTKDDDRRHN